MAAASHYIGSNNLTTQMNFASVRNMTSLTITLSLSDLNNDTASNDEYNEFTNSSWTSPDNVTESLSPDQPSSQEEVLYVVPVIGLGTPLFDAIHLTAIVSLAISVVVSVSLLIVLCNFTGSGNVKKSMSQKKSKSEGGSRGSSTEMSDKLGSGRGGYTPANMHGSKQSNIHLLDMLINMLIIC